MKIIKKSLDKNIIYAILKMKGEKVMRKLRHQKEKQYQELMNKQNINCEVCEEYFEVFNELLGKIQKYFPDFYLPDTKTYIEIVGSRQAYSANQNKYTDFKKQYPELDFRILTPDGKPYHSTKRLDIRWYDFRKTEIEYAKDILNNKPKEIKLIIEKLEKEFSNAEIAIRLDKSSQYAYNLKKGNIKPKLVSLLILIKLLKES